MTANAYLNTTNKNSTLTLMFTRAEDSIDQSSMWKALSQKSKIHKDRLEAIYPITYFTALVQKLLVTYWENSKQDSLPLEQSSLGIPKLNESPKQTYASADTSFWHVYGLPATALGLYEPHGALEGEWKMGGKKATGKAPEYWENKCQHEAEKDAQERYGPTQHTFQPIEPDAPKIEQTPTRELNHRCPGLLSAGV
eukprot:CAMPEP_0184348326 /NCGR_PEP_ID=MMETSP1089-20130417/27571_1 /TAXON_ID=38269 ORGANISM="Gloeochaete wittrockiana, Strain SAG46.84" /NCGR_SAMPLE_ID=MMETSP1089 /ASSEMBLY_ACC=CAM_ASM_000445 /LENGTH=195 /DNA_ID=CAMNT_0026679983 /DNA_START=257 /DNA_END=845 /DNA_ORIENTATION=+